MIYTSDIIGDQWKIFLEALAVGFVLGGCYDVFRIIRTVFKFGKKLFIASDFIFCLWAGFLSFSFLLNRNFGILRGYILFGEGIGFLAWYFSIGRAAVPFGKILRKILSPFVKIFRKIIKKAEKQYNKRKIFIIKAADKQKSLLKSKTGMVYNILCLNVSKAFSFCGKKAGKEHRSFENSRTEKNEENKFSEDCGYCIRNIYSDLPDFHSGKHKQ